MGDNPTLQELEETIRKSEDHNAKFTYSQYEELLSELKKDKYLVLTMNEMSYTFNDKKVIVGMRHDVDHNPFKALEMARLEKNAGFKTTYYFLATAPYYGKIMGNQVERYSCMEEVYKEIFALHHEIGIHNDLLTIMIKYQIDPFSFNFDEIEFYRSLNIRIKGSSAHGSYIAHRTVPNYEIFSDFAKVRFIEYNSKIYEIGIHSLTEFGFNYEAYFVKYNKYYSESGGSWGFTGGFYQFLNELKKSKPGDRIQLLTHPDWWGKK
ncbi:MAG: hypothetical protein NTU44_17685 [Bacteroidetes bacterium]|nr:hypothetical protein [Bacteroidota bacterium]